MRVCFALLVLSQRAIYNDLVLSFNYNYRLAKPLDGKGDDEETVEDHEQVLKSLPSFPSLSPFPRKMRWLMMT